MSATRQVSKTGYIIDSDPQPDADKEQFGCNGGIKNRNGKMVLYFTAWGKSKEVATNRAEVICHIMEAWKLPPES